MKVSLSPFPAEHYPDVPPLTIPLHCHASACRVQRNTPTPTMDTRPVLPPGQVIESSKQYVACSRLEAATRELARAEQAVAVVGRHEEVSEDDRDDRHELHHNVERRARGVLEGVAHRVADDGGSVHIGLLAGIDAKTAVGGGDALLASHDCLITLLVLVLEVFQPLLDVGAICLGRRAVVGLLLKRAVAVHILGSLAELLLVKLWAAVAEGEVAIELALLGVLLAVVPRAARVGHADGQLH